MGKSYFDGGVFQLIGWKFLAYLLTAVTFGIGYPWALCMLQRWETKHTVIESKRLVFSGKGSQLIGLWILLSLIPYFVIFFCAWLTWKLIQNGFIELVFLLYICVTAGVLCYSSFVNIQIKKWTVKHTEFQEHITSASGEVKHYSQTVSAAVENPHSSESDALSSPLSSLLFLIAALLISVAGLITLVFHDHFIVGLCITAAGLIMLLVSYFNQ